jgi:hypothetical protein
VREVNFSICILAALELWKATNPTTHEALRQSRLGFGMISVFGMIKSIRNRLNFGQDPIM